MNQLDIRLGFQFPWTFRFVGALLVFSALVLFQQNFWWSIMLFVIGVVIITAYEGTDIDVVNKVYREYNSILFIKVGKFKAYDSIEKLYVNKKTISQRMYSAHTSKSATFSNDVFSGYLKFTSGDKILLSNQKSKEKLLKKLDQVIQSLNVPLIDNS